MKYFLLFFFIWFASYIAYSSWHRATHATVSIHLSFNKEERGAMSYLLHNAKVSYLNNDGHILARGIYFQYSGSGFIEILNPEISKVQDIKVCVNSRNALLNGERNHGTNNFKKCFLNNTEWVSTWVDDFKHLQIENNNCYSLEIPVNLDKSQSSFFMYFVFWSPHVDFESTATRHYSDSVMIEKSDCIALTEKINKKY